MFLNVFVNRFKIVLRSVDAILWSLAFALALGTLFYFAFKSIYKNAMKTTVDVAVVEGDEQFDSGNIVELLKELEYEDGTKMLVIKNVDIEEAKELLDAKEPKVSGIIDLRDMADIKLIINETGVKSAWRDSPWPPRCRMANKKACSRSIVSRWDCPTRHIHPW